MTENLAGSVMNNQNKNKTNLLPPALARVRLIPSGGRYFLKGLYNVSTLAKLFDLKTEGIHRGDKTAYNLLGPDFEYVED